MWWEGDAGFGVLRHGRKLENRMEEEDTDVTVMNVLQVYIRM